MKNHQQYVIRFYLETYILKSINKLFFLMALLSFNAFSNIQLETMTVILDSSEPRKAFNVKNISKNPVLLATSVNDIDEKDKITQYIMITPPIVRIEPGESQQINFILKENNDIKDEKILKASFQSVVELKNSTTQMPIRQDIAMLVTPADLVITQEPWSNLVVSQSGNNIFLQNKGRQVIRLSKSITLLPENKSVNINQFYLRPGERIQVLSEGKTDNLVIYPLSRYGFKTPNNITLPVTH